MFFTKMKLFHNRNIILNKDISHDQTIHMAFVLHGGVGDTLISSLYIQELRKKIKSHVEIDVFAYNNDEINIAIFRGAQHIDNVFERNEYKNSKKKYDYFCQIMRYPQVDYINKDKIIKLSPWLYDYYQDIMEYRANNQKLFENAPFCNTQITMIAYLQKKKRLQVPDINGVLGITEASRLSIEVKKEAYDILKLRGLFNRNFITIHRGVDLNLRGESSKEWPILYYNRLCNLIKKKYPKYLIVQLGASPQRCPQVESADINLVGKTSFEELMAILSTSCLHIDNDSGLVHLRHFLRGGSSVVLFGPTSPEVFGYSENTNIRDTICPIWCEWISNNWQKKCWIDNKQAICMSYLHPKKVFEAVEKYIKE